MLPLQSLPPAPLALRFINWVVDRVLSYSLAIGSSVGIYLVVETGIGVKVNPIIEIVYFAFAMIIGIFLYYFLLEHFLGRTFGKVLTNTRVVTENDSRPSAGKIILRTIGRAIPFDEFIIFVNKGHALHDSIADTKVVQAKLLPAAQRKRGKILTALAVILLLPIVGLFGSIGYDAATGGERIELSQSMPADLKLVKYEMVKTDDNTYYVLTYQGKNRTVQIDRLLAGYDFDPEIPCSYMTPTNHGSVLSDTIDPALSCSPINSHAAITAYKVAATGPLQVEDSKVPDYILAKPPYRYAIKATTGTLNDQEALDMTKNYQKYTSDQLQALAHDTQR